MPADACADVVDETYDRMTAAKTDKAFAKVSYWLPELIIDRHAVILDRAGCVLALYLHEVISEAMAVRRCDRRSRRLRTLTPRPQAPVEEAMCELAKAPTATLGDGLAKYGDLFGNIRYSAYLISSMLFAAMSVLESVGSVKASSADPFSFIRCQRRAPTRTAGRAPERGSACARMRPLA